MFNLRGISEIAEEHQLCDNQWNGPMMGCPVKHILHQVGNGSVVMVQLRCEPFIDNIFMSGL